MTSTPMTVAWMDLRSAALSAISRGWPVTPGTYRGTDQRWGGRQDATRLCPVSGSWQHTPVTNPGNVYEVWGEHPYRVLLIRGHGVDVLELPQVPVVAAARPERRLLFTATGSHTLASDLILAKARQPTAGDWVALPPTTTRYLAPQRWIQPPPRGGTRRLPTTDEVRAALLTALARSRLDTGTGDEPE